MINFFGITLHAYGFFIGLAIVVAVLVAEKIIKKQQLPVSVDLLFFPVMMSGLIGARVYHLITDWPLYHNASLLELVAVWNGGLGVIGGLVGGLMGLYGVLWWQQKKQFFMEVLDILALAIPLAQAIGRWGNYFNQELFGRPTLLPWAITIDEQFRPTGYQQFSTFHPLFLYEMILNLFLFGTLWWGYQTQKWIIGSGRLVSLYIMGYSMIRFSLEFLRIESARLEGIFGVLTIAQWMMIVLGVAALLLFRHTVRK